MKKIRIGNDINVVWQIKENGVNANLADQTTDIPLTLKLDSVLIALLSAGEIAVATNKNWNVII